MKFSNYEWPPLRKVSQNRFPVNFAEPFTGNHSKCTIDHLRNIDQYSGVVLKKPLYNYDEATGHLTDFR